MTSNQQSIRLLCDENLEGTIPQPKPASVSFETFSNKHREPPVFLQASQVDARVNDALSLGWCLQPPTELAFKHNDDDNVINLDTEHELVTTISTDDDESYTGLIDLEWFITVPTSVNALVTAPLFEQNSPVVPQIFTPSTEPTKLTIPVHVEREITIVETTPFIQIIPLSTTISPDKTDDNISAFTNDIRTLVDRRRALHKLYDSPYRERIRRTKQFGHVTSSQRD